MILVSITSISLNVFFSVTVEVDCVFLIISSKIVELEEELRVVGNNLKSLEVSEEKVKQFDHFINPP